VTTRRQRIALVLASLVVSLVLIEAALRLVGAGIFDDQFLTGDVNRGWSLKPAFSGWTLGENQLWVTINRDGLRDREHALDVPADTVRVAVLGDSYMQGVNVPLEKTFPSYLEAALAPCATRVGKKVETVNFGVEGYGTAQELLTFQHHAVRYKPAVVLLAVYTNNDIYNNSRVLNPASFPGDSPYFVFDGDRLVLDNSFRRELEKSRHPPWWRRARIVATDRSRAVQLAYQFWLTVRSEVEERFPRQRDPDRFGDLEEIENQIYVRPAIPEVAEAWRVTEGLLLMLDEQVRAQGAEFWIVTLSNLRQVDPDVSARRALEQKLGIETLFYPDFRIRDFANANGIHAIALAPPMADYAAEKQVYLHGGYNSRAPFGAGHWNEVGNRLGADLVSADLCRRSRALTAGQ